MLPANLHTSINTLNVMKLHCNLISLECDAEECGANFQAVRNGPRETMFSYVEVNQELHATTPVYNFVCRLPGNL